MTEAQFAALMATLPTSIAAFATLIVAVATLVTAFRNNKRSAHRSAATIAKMEENTRLQKESVRAVTATSAKTDRIIEEMKKLATPDPR
jgi:hypothetical protein